MYGLPCLSRVPFDIAAISVVSVPWCHTFKIYIEKATMVEISNWPSVPEQASPHRPPISSVLNATSVWHDDNSSFAPPSVQVLLDVPPIPYYQFHTPSFYMLGYSESSHTILSHEIRPS
ncbi:MAG: hypothetical protein ACK56I_09285, partial [bacterium]